jgi:hypothetical protein
MKTIYQNPNILNVYYNGENNYIILKWDSFNITLKEIQKMHRIILTYAIENDCHVYVAETSYTTSKLSDDIINWWKTEWIQEMQKNGIRLIVTVYPRNILAQISTTEWQNGNYGSIKMMNVFNLKQASKTIEELR